MQKGFIRLLAIVITTCLATACSNSRNVTITNKAYTEKEQTIIRNAGGVDGERFEVKGSVLASQHIEVTLERYEKGKLIDGEPFTWMDSELGVDGDLSFAVATKNEYGSDRVIISMPSTNVTLNLDELKSNGFSHGSLVDKKNAMALDEPVYIAYWIGTEGDSLSSLQLDDNEKVRVEEYDICLLLKLEVKEK